MNRSVKGLAAVAAVSMLSAAACEKHHQIGGLGGSSDSDGGGGPGGGPFAQLPDAGPPREVGVLGPTTTWSGYIENGSPSGSFPDPLSMTFASDEAGQVVGTLRFGSATPPPPATDPNVGYPPALPSDNGAFGPEYPRDGFTYTMIGGTLAGNRLRFGFSTIELWTGWCALQTPGADGSGTCLPYWLTTTTAEGTCYQTNPATGQHVPVDCGKVTLCSLPQVCICDQHICVANRFEPNHSADMIISGDRADGSIVNGDLTVHFTKDP